MTQPKDGCVRPAKGPIAKAAVSEVKDAVEPQKEVPAMQARVGREAPDFEANAFVNGEGFKLVQLSSYRGKWIVLCFYPGDFTFV